MPARSRETITVPPIAPRLRLLHWPPWWRSGTGSLKRMMLLGVLAVCFLQYYYINVMIEIYSLPALIVFLPSTLPTSG